MNTMSTYRIRETKDFFSLSVLFHESGLGVEIEEETPNRILKMWRMDDSESGDLIGAVTLEMRDGVYALGDIAVKAEFRGRGCGAALQQTVLEEARSRGIHELWACAKEPEYYRHHGWEKKDWDTSPDLAVYCTSCGKRGRECHPEKMFYSLDASKK